jgi:hypothetical protein
MTVLKVQNRKNSIQGVSEVCVLILTSERSRQCMKVSSITFGKMRKSFPRFLAPQFLLNESFCFYFFVTMRIKILII